MHHGLVWNLLIIFEASLSIVTCNKKLLLSQSKITNSTWKPELAGDLELMQNFVYNWLAPKGWQALGLSHLEGESRMKRNGERKKQCYSSPLFKGEVCSRNHVLLISTAIKNTWNHGTDSVLRFQRVIWPSEKWFKCAKNWSTSSVILNRSWSFFFFFFFSSLSVFPFLVTWAIQKIDLHFKKIISAITKAMAIGNPRVVGSIIRADFMPALLANQ